MAVRRWRSGSLGVVVIGVVVLTGACSGSTTADAPEPALDAPPPTATLPASTAVDLSTLPAVTATLYRFVEANAAVAARIRCYCGCGPAQGHRSLADCFLMAGGAYNAHASGCGVCLGEAQQVQTLLAEGTDPATIRAQIDAQWASAGPGTETS